MKTTSHHWKLSSCGKFVGLWLLRIHSVLLWLNSPSVAATCVFVSSHLGSPFDFHTGYSAQALSGAELSGGELRKLCISYCLSWAAYTGSCCLISLGVCLLRLSYVFLRILMSSYVFLCIPSLTACWQTLSWLLLSWPVSYKNWERENFLWKKISISTLYFLACFLCIHF